MPPRAPRLLVIVDRDALGSDAAVRWQLQRWTDLAAEEPQLGVQLRIKQQDAAAQRLIAQCATELGELRQLVALNGSTSMALAHGFGGVHWPEASIDEQSTSAVGSLRVSAAAHSSAAAQAAAAAGAHFVVFGAVFPPLSKAGQGLGIEALAAVAQASTLPVLAVGGVLPAGVAACRLAGAAGVATIGGACNDLDAHHVLAAYLGAWHAID